MTNYFHFIVQETCEIMSEMGVTRLVDLIGRTDLLCELDGITVRQNKLDLAPMRTIATPHPGKVLYCTEECNPPFDPGSMNKALLQQARPYVDARQSKTFYLDIHNTDRSLGASLSGAIADIHGD